MTDLTGYRNGIATELYFKAEIPGHTLLFTDGDITRVYPPSTGDTYSNKGSLMTIGQTESNISVSPTDLTITIDGIQAANLAAATSASVKYAPVTLLRAWIDPATDAPLLVGGQPAVETRFKGFISSVNFEESWNAPDSGFAITFSCISSASRLTDLVSGRRTNNADMKAAFPTDTSFKRVAKLTNANFQFGVPNAQPTAGTNS